MNKNLLKDLLRQVWATRGRFISILAIIALGCGFFVGIKATSPDMKYTADLYYDEYNLADFHLISTLGFEEEDLSAVRETAGFDAVEAGYSADLFAVHPKTADLLVKTYSYDANSQEINRLQLTEGRMPEKADECLVDAGVFVFQDVQIGDTIQLATNDPDRDIAKILNTQTFTVVGRAKTPQYVSLKRGTTTIGDGSLQGLIYLPQEAYAYEAFTDLYLTQSGLKALQSYSDAYQDAVDEKTPELEALADSRIQARTAEIEKKLDDGRKEYNDGKAEYEENKTKFDTEIADAKQKLSDSRALLEKNQKAYDDGLAQYNAALGQWDTAGVPQLAQLESLGEYLDPQGQAALAALRQNKAVLDASGAKLQSSKAQLDAGWKELRNGEAELSAQEKEGAQKLSDAAVELDEAAQKLADSEKDANDALDNAQWYVLDRTSNIGYTDFQMDSDRVDSIARVFPVFFILVAALVCLTTMTRMVEEQRTQIGTLKALGYSNGAIVFQYLAYSITASVAGGFLGLAAGFQVFPRAVFGAYKMLYMFEKVHTQFRWDYAVACIAVAILCTGASSVAACYKELAAQPAQLMRPKPPKNGKRVWLENIPILWKHLGFNAKVTLRNVFRYKDRVLMTVLGIAGCTALMLAGFGLQYSVSSIVDKQFGEIFVYDLLGVVDDKADSSAKQALDNTLANSPYVQDSMYTYQKSIKVTFGKESQTVYLVVPEDGGALPEYIRLRERTTGNKLQLSENGVILNERLGQLLKADQGDAVEIEGVSEPLTITGLTENYAYNYIYMPPEVYEKYFGTLEPNSFMARMENRDDQDALSADLLKSGSVLNLSFTTESGKNFQDLVKSLNSIVLVLIVSAGTLAFVVLYNLANININERIRELATIKVLGFYDMEVSGYIYRENTISSVLGMALGLVGGVFLERFVVQTAQMDMVMFTPDIPISSFVYSGILTLLFAFTVNMILHFKLKNIDMASSMKAIE